MTMKFGQTALSRDPSAQLYPFHKIGRKGGQISGTFMLHPIGPTNPPQLHIPRGPVSQICDNEVWTDSAIFHGSLLPIFHCVAINCQKLPKAPSFMVLFFQFFIFFHLFYIFICGPSGRVAGQGVRHAKVPLV